MLILFVLVLHISALNNLTDLLHYLILHVRNKKIFKNNYFN